MTTKITIMFPYSGFESEDRRETLFWNVINISKEVDSNLLIVLNRDTLNGGGAKAFLNDIRSRSVKQLNVWAVDTCQMWLAGWGEIFDNDHDNDINRVVLLPGDIDEVANERDFFRKLRNLIQATQPEITIGDFETGNLHSSKELIDTYGTYSLLANWFPGASKGIHQLPLRRPRSEFLNIDATTLKTLLLTNRKFAYEQTLNILIRSWDHQLQKWSYEVSPHSLGTFHDDTTFRKYPDALDQIERTERMLRLLWRELNAPEMTGDSPKDEIKYKEFIDEYDKLDRASTGIRESARITIRALLGV